MGKVIDLTGRVFERLTVVARAGNNKWGKALWLCRCSCNGENNEKIIVGSSLLNGLTQSCGCLSREKVIRLNKETKRKYNTYDLTGEYGIGYTEKNEKFYFDLEDYDLIKNYYWRLEKYDYVVTNDSYNNDKYIRMHRLITDCPNDMEVDHIFHDNWDNRKEFLRIVDRSKNCINRGLFSNNTSGVTGVSWSNRNDNWQAQIMINNQPIHLGFFNNFNDAVKVRKQAEKEYHREYTYKK